MPGRSTSKLLGLRDCVVLKLNLGRLSCHYTILLTYRTSVYQHMEGSIPFLHVNYGGADAWLHHCFQESLCFHGFTSLYPNVRLAKMTSASLGESRRNGSDNKLGLTSSISRSKRPTVYWREHQTQKITFLCPVALLAGGLGPLMSSG